MEMNAFFIHTALAIFFLFSETIKTAGLHLTVQNVKEDIYAIYVRQNHF